MLMDSFSNAPNTALVGVYYAVIITESFNSPVSNGNRAAILFRLNVALAFVAFRCDTCWSNS